MSFTGYYPIVNDGETTDSDSEISSDESFLEIHLDFIDDSDLSSDDSSSDDSSTDDSSVDSDISTDE